MLVVRPGSIFRNSLVVEMSGKKTSAKGFEIRSSFGGVVIGSSKMLHASFLSGDKRLTPLLLSPHSYCFILVF